MASVGPFTQFHYPESDGKPMGETDEHRDAMVRHIQILQEYYRDQRVYVSGDLLVYYEEGDPSKYVVPDAFVVKGVAPNRRRTYKIWLEGRGRTWCSRRLRARRGARTRRRSPSSMRGWA